jgi:hypothetical protein
MLALTQPLRIGLSGMRRTELWRLDQVSGLTHPVENSDMPKYENTMAAIKHEEKEKKEFPESYLHEEKEKKEFPESYLHEEKEKKEFPSV